MRRSTIITSVESILAALESSGVAAIVGSSGQSQAQGRQRPSPAEVIRRFHEFATAAAKFDDAHLEVLSAFELESLLDTNTWLSFAVEDESASSTLHRGLNYKYRTFRAYAPKVLSIIETEGLRMREDPPPGAETLAVTVPVSEGEHASADRVVKALQGVQKLYGVCARLVDVEDGELTIVSCDSGPDLVFDVMGDALVMPMLQELLTSIWERVVFHRALEPEERNQRVVDTLPVLHRVTKALDAGTIDRDTAEQLRRRVQTGATSFIEAGCLIDAFEKPMHESARALLAPPSQKLIAGPAPAEPEARKPVVEAEVEDVAEA